MAEVFDVLEAPPIQNFMDSSFGECRMKSFEFSS
jgi:hypothetical protein